MEKLNIAEIDNIIWHLRNSMNNGDISKCAGRLEEYIYELTGYEPKPKIVPKFKVGDRIKSKNIHTNCLNDNHIFTITEISGGRYWSNRLAIEYIEKQDDWELVPNKFDITTLKPFESRVLVRGSNDDIWKPAIWGIYNDIYCSAYPYITTYGATCQCIPYEDNQHLLGTTNDCDEYFKTWEE